MYIMSQNGEISVNSTALISFGIEKTKFLDEETSKAFPEPYVVIAYGKGDKEYRMGLYTDKEDAVWNLKRQHEAMKNAEKTFRFGPNYKLSRYIEERIYEKEKASHADDNNEDDFESFYS
jgi:hypothetical protein